MDELPKGYRPPPGCFLFYEMKTAKIQNTKYTVASPDWRWRKLSYSRGWRGKRKSRRPQCTRLHRHKSKKDTNTKNTNTSDCTNTSLRTLIYFHDKEFDLRKRSNIHIAKSTYSSEYQLSSAQNDDKYRNPQKIPNTQIAAMTLMMVVACTWVSK